MQHRFITFTHNLLSTLLMMHFTQCKHGAEFKHKSNLAQIIQRSVHAIHALEDVAAVVRYYYDP